MKEVVLKWRGRDILIRYQCIDFGGFQYAKVLDKNGKETHLHKRKEEGRYVWRGGGTRDWPEDLIILLSDFFNDQELEQVSLINKWR